MVGYYIHNLDPVIVRLGGPLAIRWYGVAYLLGFLAGFLILRRESRAGRFQVPPGEVSNFIVGLGFFGVLVGARLGYALLYNLTGVLADPWSLLRLWEGGMASHGGMVGVGLFLWWYSRRHRVSFWNLTDHVCFVGPVGIFFGRVANFINGELWGRVTQVPWAVVFPLEAEHAPGRLPPRADLEAMVAAGRLHPRHPSQLYEAAVEGLLLFAALALIRRTRWGKSSGAVTASFLALYAAGRIGCEFLREPDSGLVFGALTRGQAYSALLLLLAALVPWLARRARIRAEDRPPSAAP